MVGTLALCPPHGLHFRFFSFGGGGAGRRAGTAGLFCNAGRCTPGATGCRCKFGAVVSRGAPGAFGSRGGAGGGGPPCGGGGCRASGRGAPPRRARAPSASGG